MTNNTLTLPFGSTMQDLLFLSRVFDESDLPNEYRELYVDRNTYEEIINTPGVHYISGIELIVKPAPQVTSSPDAPQTNIWAPSNVSSSVYLVDNKSVRLVDNKWVLIMSPTHES